MRIAVFSDVHGNAVALQAVIDAARELGTDAYWVIGDLVANGPQPVEALKLQRCQLPDGTRVLLVHASPGRDDGPGLTPDASDREAACQGWADCGADLVFTGHTHVPLERTIGGVRVINVGSVSVPPEARGATWTTVDVDKNGYSVQRHVTDYDLAAVSDALEVSHHPGAHWLTKKLHLTNASPASAVFRQPIRLRHGAGMVVVSWPRSPRDWQRLVPGSRLGVAPRR